MPRGYEHPYTYLQIYHHCIDEFIFHMIHFAQFLLGWGQPSLIQGTRPDLNESNLLLGLFDQRFYDFGSAKLFQPSKAPPLTSLNRSSSCGKTSFDGLVLLFPRTLTAKLVHKSRSTPPSPLRIYYFGHKST